MTTSNLLYRCSAIRDALVDAGLFAASAGTSAAGDADTALNSWRIGTVPFLLSADQIGFFRRLGPHLLSFYRALNRLYAESARGLQPSWIAEALDRGKPEGLVSYSRMKRFRDLLPAVIRPDVIPTADGMVITELDSVPGGIGLTACLSRAYADNGFLNPEDPSSPATMRLVGGRDGMIDGFGAMLTHLRGSREGCTAVVVSDEAKDYRPEMTWMTARLSERGIETRCVQPRDVRFTEGTLRIVDGDREQPIALMYRFFELFDLPNIPKSELIQYAAKKDWVTVTPPYKPALEEKSAFALLHHPMLRSFWRRELREDTWLHLTTVMPRTWLLDPAPVPPQATIPGLSIGDRAITNWRDLLSATQKERHFVIKPSGFSELAWGSRGVSIGHDLPQSEWATAIDEALAAFPRTPYILQEFHKGRQYHLEYYDPASGEMRQMAGRARLSPYYFVAGEKVELAGILATVCPADKKIIHGMKDAILVPCAVAPEGQPRAE
ncbi:conserved protein of unknown function [Nitrospira japonica]|uniref:Glutathionylspermidine synthase pre-ATP-grasp-like domain-containing protein n=1 Tax=Nitrospira japonica TaxID=1325564 RepID=A0A1W1I0R6_9BACT|nr:hypothetical protein [Nitrospira japonica]SLM46595.1 conserved protein of unknown function [Nitrospira japonica]